MRLAPLHIKYCILNSINKVILLFYKEERYDSKVTITGQANPLDNDTKVIFLDQTLTRLKPVYCDL